MQTKVESAIAAIIANAALAARNRNRNAAARVKEIANAATRVDQVKIFLRCYIIMRLPLARENVKLRFSLLTSRKITMLVTS